MPLKGRPPEGYEKWMEDAAELMVYEHMRFSPSCQAIGKHFDNSAEERKAELSDAFNSVLESVQKANHSRLLKELTKEAMEATLWDVTKELIKEKAPDKVYGPASLIMKMRGWAIEEKASEPVLGNLTQEELDKLKAELKAQQESKMGPVQ